MRKVEPLKTANVPDKTFQGLIRQFEERMIVLSDDGDRGAMLFIVALDRRFIRGTSVDGNLLRHPMTADRLGQKPLGGFLVPMLRQEEIDRLAGLIHGAIEVVPLASG